ncbi:MAG: metallophosphoesterase [Selenomonadaceae bacterium]|nr:metallophosphoesterase [Selenomonadaceae bacterium]
MEKERLEAAAGFGLNPENGCLERGFPHLMATEGFCLADKGSRLHLLDRRYRYMVACYRPEFADKYIHTYDYAPEQIWGSYDGVSSRVEFGEEDFVFDSLCYFRLCLRRVDGEEITEADAEAVGDMVEYTSTAIQRTPKVFLDEVQKAAEKVNNLRSDGDLVLTLLADTHATVNGTWQDTAANLLSLQEKIHFDGLVHLGDMTDGTVSRDMTKFYVSSMLHDLESLKVPVHIVLGNHDANYFHGNPEVMPLHEQAAIYQAEAAKWKQDKDKTYYHVDDPPHKLRGLFLSAYQNEAEPRYGFDLAQIAWVRETLKETPQDWRVLIFSHDAPLPELDPWSEEIRNGSLLLQALDSSEAQVLAYIHGHAHADYVYPWQGKKSFPIIAIGCAKCEDMTERKVEGSFTPARVLGEASQELWDILMIKNSGRLHFIRFGAGKDRNI